ncbi:N-acetylmuramoyl-L-alanine amidase [Pandoraea anapnoica]|uniref:N-acetylmuramoyl-L-alanine amidase n=1 Tax=Pandoraea anapnoica TaxID=2508301 RepID=A0A5E4ZUZ3_9BURK|nr:N-acetylmuramoyl-L-alanine amidase [Pandoraea anapnoica]VVE64312.1 N-acetylmuramoyl-L-alanine amidase [Pandoraea anapnoica]
MPHFRETPDDLFAASAASNASPRRKFLTRATAICSALVATPLTLHANESEASASSASSASSDSSDSSGASPASIYDIDTSIASPNQAPRIRTLVLHYTAVDLCRSLQILTDPDRTPAVSSHYLIPDTAGDDGRFTVYSLAPESRLAHHAGVSWWLGERLLNGSSIGLEIVNLGFPASDNRVPLMQRQWYEYPEAQVAVVAQLVMDIVRRHQIAPNRIVGHADIAPGRKTDPGPLFPWKELHVKYGIGAWPDAGAVDWYVTHRPYDGDIDALQAKLRDYGYDTPRTGELDTATRNVIESFQMHFCASERYDGEPDPPTVAVLDALLEKYLNRPRPSDAGGPRTA